MLEIAFKSNSRLRGTLIMDRDLVRRMTRIEPSFISLTQGSEAERAPVEALIESLYASSYQAVIPTHYPNLIAVHAGDGRVIAAAGFRLASAGPLFLESYLAAPVERLIGAHTRTVVVRPEVVEIGNLVSANRGGSIFLFVTLAAFLQRNRFTYAVATATAGLTRLFETFGINSIELGRARPEALPDGGVSWGTYYRSNPRVLAGALAPARARLESFLPEARNGDLDAVFAVFHSSTEARFQ